MKTIFTSAVALIATSVFAQNANQTKSVQDSVAKTIDLKEVRISVPSKTRMKDGAMITRIVASPLEGVGNAEDVLARVPGMMTMQGELQVIGKGAPTYYINGRKVHDITELKRLSSHDIKDVEVITTPGSQYDAQTRAVVRIRTVRQKGEGVGVTFDTNDAVAPSCGNNQLGTTLGLNYRHNSLDIFGGATFDSHHLARYHTDATQQLFTTHADEPITYVQTGGITTKQQYNSLKYNLGFNLQLSDDHSIGLRIERNDNLKGITDFNMDNDMFFNGSKSDHLITNTHTDADGVNSWLANMYYNGKVKNLGIDFNADYYLTDECNTATAIEQTDNDERTVVSTNDAKNRLFATKLVLTYPVWKGTLQAGTEMAFVKRHNKYDITETSISDDKADVTENTYAAFMEYGCMIEKVGMLKLGLRYEHTDFEYLNKYNNTLDLKRKMDDFFPFLNFSTKLGEVSTSLSYTVRTRRPNYRVLRNNIEYNNRFSLSTGDPTLKNEIRHEAGLSGQWRWLSFSLSYSCQKDGIYDWSFPYKKDSRQTMQEGKTRLAVDDTESDGTVLLGWVNFSKPIHSVSAFINVSPTVGVWSPNYTIGVQKQWLSFDLTDPRTATGMRTVTYNRPMFIFNANNTFRLPTRNEDGKGAWQFELNSELYSKAHFGNAEIHNWFWNLTVAVQKSFLKDDALTVRLSASDIFHTAYNRISIDLGNYIYSQNHNLGEGRSIYDLQRISLSVRYKFNAVKSKYHGSGAGNEMRQRM